MGTNENYEQEIDLKDLFFSVLRRWRLVILIAVIFALLAGGFRTSRGIGQLRDADFIKSNQETYQDAVEQYEMTSQRLEREISNLEINIESQQEYKENSILMNINPYDVYVETASFYISTDYSIMPGMLYQNPNTSTSILKAYVTIAQNGEMFNYVLGKMDNGMSLRYLKELVNIKADFDNNMLDISVVADNEKRANDVMRYIKDSMQQSQNKITEAIGEHVVNQVDESQYVSVDMALEQEQSELTALTDQMVDELQTKKLELEELHEPSNTLLSRKSLLISAIKYAILGGVLGAFMMIFFICVAFMMSDKLINDKELKRRYGIMILGVFKKTNKSKFLPGIDRWFDKLEGTAARELEDAQALDVVTANAMNYMDGIKQVLLIGTADSTAIERVREGLSNRLGDITLLTGGNLGKDVQAIKEVASCDAVILVEQRNHSLFSQVEQELDVVKSLDKKIIGCVVL